jgi:hypothetical protein
MFTPRSARTAAPAVPKVFFTPRTWTDLPLPFGVGLT